MGATVWVGGTYRPRRTATGLTIDSAINGLANYSENKSSGTKMNRG